VLARNGNQSAIAQAPNLTLKTASRCMNGNPCSYPENVAAPESHLAKFI